MYLVHRLGLRIGFPLPKSIGESMTLGRRVQIGALVYLLALISVPCFGSTLTVTNTNDSGPGSLRDAIAAAAPGDTIELSVSGTITLSSTLTITRDLTIHGPGASSLAISGNGSVLVLDVPIASGATVQVSGITITKGFGGVGAGGVFNGSTMVLADCVVSGNSGVGAGGGIFNYSNNRGLTIIRSTVSGNRAVLGGGIWNNPNAALTIIDSTISDNVSTANGGGINNVHGFVTISGSTISGNTGENGGGLSTTGTAVITDSTISGNSGSSAGGIFNWEGSTLTMTGSTLSGNRTSSWGGGISSWGTVNIANSTFFGNSAGNGGGIFHYAGPMAISSSTFSRNSAAESSGAAIWNQAPQLTVKNSILAGSPSGGNCGGSAGDSAGHNLSDDTSCSAFFVGAGDSNAQDAGLDPAGPHDNGGATMTIALMPGSAALDAIPASACTDAASVPVTTDQRGISRPQGSACDIGSVEIEAPSDATAPVVTAALTPAANSAGWRNSDVTIAWSASDPESGIASGPLPGSAVATADGAGQVFAADATNGAGLVGHGSVTVNLDKTRPTLTITGVVDGGVYGLGSSLHPAVQCDDATSGVASSSGSLAGGNGNGVGTFTYSATCTDRAGNASTSSATFRVVYSFGGFLQPIALPVSSFQGGSTIPVKFSIADGAGENVATAVAIISANGIVVGTATYDADERQYRFNLATSGFRPGVLIIAVGLDDGTSREAIVTLR